MTYTNVRSFRSGTVTLENELSGGVFEREAASIVTVTARLPAEGLYHDLANMKARWDEAGIATLSRIGDCYAPSTSQSAVYAGHK